MPEKARKTISSTTLLVLIATAFPLQATEISVHLKDDKNKALSNIAVWVTPNNITSSTLTTPVTINQIGKAFDPYLNIMQVGQPLVFANNDDISHHIFSASRDKNFSFRLKKGESNSSVEFTKGVSIAMGCNVHDWMSGHLLVVETPYFAITDSSGKVTLNVKELGEAKVEIWHPQITDASETLKRSINITEISTTLEFQLKKPMDKIPEQKSGDDFDFLDDY